MVYNVHENIGQTQQGGTSLLLFGHLTEQLDHNKSGKGDTGLGRWLVMTLQGDGVRCVGTIPARVASSTVGQLTSSTGDSWSLSVRT